MSLILNWQRLCALFTTILRLNSFCNALIAWYLTAFISTCLYFLLLFSSFFSANSLNSSYMKNLDRIVKPSYSVKYEDVVFLPIRQTTCSRSMTLRMYNTAVRTYFLCDQEDIIDHTATHDLSGFLTTKTPIHLIYYTLALSDFDLITNKGKNRMQAAIDYFHEIRNMPCFAKTKFVLVLTKCDLFDEKMKRKSSFKKHFPDFGDEKESRDSVCQYLMLKLFKGLGFGRFSV